MVAYSCKICMFHSDNKSKYERHLKTIKHREKEKYEDDYIGYVDDDMNSCKYCGKIYKHKQSLMNHIKYNCDKNKDEDIKELVRLLNAQIKQNEKIEEFTISSNFNFRYEWFCKCSKSWAYSLRKSNCKYA